MGRKIAFFKKMLLVIAILIILAIATFLILQTQFVERRIADFSEDALENRLGARMTIGQLDLTLSPLAVYLKNVRVFGGKNNEKIFADIPSITVRLSYGSFWTRPVPISELILTDPSFHLDNLPELMKREETKEPFRLPFNIDDVQVVNGEVKVRQFHIYDLNASGIVYAERIELPRIVGQLQDVRFQASGQIAELRPVRYRFEYEATGNANAVAKTISGVPPVSGALKTSGVIRGEGGEYKIHGSAESESFAVMNEPPFPFTGEYTISNAKTNPLRFDVNFQSVPMTIAHKFSSAVPLIGSTGRGTFVYEGPTNIWQGQGSIAVTLTPSNLEGLAIAGTVEAEIGRGRIRIQQSNLQLDSSRFIVRGNLSENSMDLQVDARITDPSDLAIFYSRLHEVPGSYVVDVSMSGNYKNLNVSWNARGTAHEMNLRTQGNYSIGNKRIEAQFSGNASGEFIDTLFPVALAGNFSFDGRVAGAISNPRISARLNSESLQFREIQLGALQATIQSDGNVLNTDVGLPEMGVTADFRYRFSNQQYSAEGQFTNLSLNRVEPLLPENLKAMQGQVTGQFTASGNVRRMAQSDARIVFADGTIVIGDRRVQLAEGAQVLIEDGQLNLDVALEMEGDIRVEGKVPMSATEPIDLRARGELDLSALAPVTGRVEVTGPATVDVRVTGTRQQPEYQGTVSAESFNMTLLDTNLQVSGGSFQAQLQGTTADVTATLPVDGSQLTAHGTVPLTRSGKLDLNVAGTANLALVQQFTEVVNASGVANVDIDLTGTFSHPQFAGEIAANDVTISAPRWDVVYSQVDLRANFANTRAQVAASGLLNGSPLTAEGVVPLDAAGQMDLDVNGTLNLAFVEQFMDQVNANGLAEIDVHIAGTFSDPDLSGEVEAQDITINAPEWNVVYSQADLLISLIDSRFEIVSEGLLNGSRLNLDAVVPLQNGEGDIALTLHSFPLSTLTPGQDLSGILTVLVDATGTGKDPQDWSGEIQIRPQRLAMEGREIQVTEPILVEMVDGRAVLHPVELQSGEFVDLNLQGMVDFETGTLDASIQGNADLVLAQVFLENTIIAGNLNTNVEIGGTTKQPNLSGNITVENGVYRKFNSPILLEEIHLVAPVTQDRIQIETLTASMGGGEITGQGTIQLEGMGLGNVNITAEARHIGMQYPQGLRSQISADVRFQSLEEDFLLSGDVRVLRSAYRSEFDPTERLVNTMLRQRRALTAPPVEEDQIQLDLQIRTIEDFQMRNNIGRIQAGANLDLTGFLNEPRLNGELRIRERSEIYFEGNTFEFQRGVIHFYGTRRIEPDFDVELFTIATDEETRQEYEITIPLYGPLTDLRERQPTSYPSLTAQQIYFLLLTGQANAQITTAGGIFFQRQLASYISGQMFSDVGRELAGALGLTRIEVRPDFFAQDTDAGAKLVITKDFTSALSLVYSTSLTDSDEYTWFADYKAPKNLTFRFINQDEGSYTASVRHLVRFGHGVSTGTLRRGREIRDREIASISITNESVLSDREVREILDAEVGDDYDYWALFDQTDEIAHTLQERGYLFPRTQLDEERISRNEYAVEVLIEDRRQRQMIFRGYEPTNDQRNKYLRFWREGFSQAGVLMFIREDLLRGLWLRGYYKAEVATDTNEGETITHTLLIEPGQRFADVNCRFEGTENYPAEELEDDLEDLYRERRAMAADAIHNFDSLGEKIQALYVQRGYLGTQVERGAVAYLPTGIARRTIKITEGPVSKIVAVEASGIEAFPPELKKQLRLNIGEVFQSRILLEDEYTIQDYYEKQGYMEAQVDSHISRNTETGGITVHYEVQIGAIATVASIQISGYEQTDRDLIEERIQLKEGEILTREKLIKAHRSLSDLRIFHQVTVEATEIDETGRQIVTINVIERNHYEVRYGVRYDTEQDFGGDIQISDINLFGTGRNLSLYTRQSQRNREYGTTFHTPALQEDLQYKTFISASYETGELLLLKQERFDGHRLHFSVQRQQKLTRKYILVSSYDFQNLTITPLDSPDIQPVEDLNVSRILGTVYADTRNDPVNALRGSFLSTDLQYSASWLGSDVNYVKNYNQYFLFKSFGNKVWASAYRLGLASDLPPRVITERFFAGGSYSIRGFEKDSVGPVNASGNVIGGEALFIINQELRFPIYKWFGGVVFYDAGNVYGGVGSFDPLDLRHSLGIGLRFVSSFGILRADYGFNLDHEREERRGVFHFGLGQAF